MTSNRAGLRTLTAVLLATVLALAVVGASSAQDPPASPTTVDLGTAGSFAILAGSAISNTGSSTIFGDIGIHPNDGDSVTGDDQWTHEDGEHYGDAVAAKAQEDLTTAYDEAAGRDVTETIGTELGGGDPLLPGVYDSESGTFEITGTLTLDAVNDPDAVFIFQMESSLVTATNSVVALVNGAQACNVFWQVGSSATLGTDSVFAGNILALTSITLDPRVTIDGRVLARNGAVTLDTATITRADCDEAGNGDDDGPADDGGPADDDGTADDGTDGTDDDGTDGTDDDGTDGTDDGTDTDGTDAGAADDGATGADGTDADGTDADGTADVDGTDADGTDGSVTTSGAAPPGLPRTGVPFALLAVGIAMLALGRGAVRVTRPGRHSA